MTTPMHANPDPPVEPKWSDELRIYGEGFVGRQEELAALGRAWAAGVRIFALHAEGGAGKTRVVVEWLRRMRDDGWRGARRVFVHSFYSQGSDERRNASSELFFEQALAYFGWNGEPITQADEKGRTLARLLVEHHGLLVLDGLEPLQHPTKHAEQGRLKDPGIARLLLSLANAPYDKTRGLCLITSRQPVTELQEREGASVIQESLDELHRDDGAELLRQFEVVGPAEELRKASDEFHGHAYSLMLLGSFLRNATDHHDIRRRREVVLLEEDTQHRSHARKMFAAYVRHLGEDSPEVAVLRLLGFFDRAAERQLLDVLRAREGVVYEWSKEANQAERRARPKRIEDSLPEVTAPLLDFSQRQWHRVLNRLRDLRLVNLTGSSTSQAVDAHPLLRESFAEQVRELSPAAWQAGHRRLFEHLRGTAPYWPEGVDGLQPLYQAVVHGCLAELHEQARAGVYRDRILRGTGAGGNYSTFTLGAIGADLGAVACFFTTPWTTLAPNLASADRAWLLSDAAFSLRALGRLSEAVEPMLVSMDMYVYNENWRAAAITADNLSQLELLRGQVAAAVSAGEESVTYADRSDDAFQQMARRTALADAMHQVGRREEARRLFEDAEFRQAAWQPEYPRLYSVQGFQYCDFLLADAERAAWQQWLNRETEFASAREVEAEGLTTITACETVSERAHQTLGWVTKAPYASVLTVTLDHLTLARVLLYKALLESSGEWYSAVEHLTVAVDGLRAAGQIDYLSRGLLTRSWLRCLSGNEADCRADLDEAREIAERGPMPLFQADIQLTRARLFRDRAALEEARWLIEKHGYHRRDGELADALEAAKGWGDGEAAKTATETRNEDFMRDQVFISYSHRDKKYLDELQTHLKPLLRSGVITAWSDKQIASGAQRFQEIQDALAKTSVAVLLVSPDFLASDFIHEHELGPLLKEADAGGVRILWIPIRPSAFEETPLQKLQAVTPPDQPLSQMSRADRDEAWVRICKEIKRFATLSAGTPASSAAPSAAASPNEAKQRQLIESRGNRPGFVSRPRTIPVLFFAFANDRAVGSRYLRNLAEEERRVREAMDKARRAGRCEVEVRFNATPDVVWNTFLDPELKDRIAVFHFAGHAGGAEILLETPEGAAAGVLAEGLAGFLGLQKSLQAVFLNGCSTEPQVQALRAAGVPVVIATFGAIEDRVAMELAGRFYQSLAADAPLGIAFQEAVHLVRTQLKSPSEAYRSFVPPRSGAADDWPWTMHGEDRSKAWKLSSASGVPAARGARAALME